MSVDPASHGRRESDLEHSFHDPGCVIADFMVGECTQAYGALEPTCSSVVVGPGSRVAIDSDVHKVLVYLHLFLDSCLPTASARIRRNLTRMPWDFSRAHCLMTPRGAQQR